LEFSLAIRPLYLSCCRHTCLNLEPRNIQHVTDPPQQSTNTLTTSESLSSYWGISESALQFVIYEHLKKSMRASSAAGQSGDR